MIDEIIMAAMLLNKADRKIVQAYIAWVQFRRMIHNRFYFRAHWIQRSHQYHWVR